MNLDRIVSHSLQMTDRLDELKRITTIRCSWTKEATDYILSQAVEVLEIDRVKLIQEAEKNCSDGVVLKNDVLFIINSI
jgi:hypothetical protein